MTARSAPLEATVRALIEDLSTGLVERETAIRLCILGTLSGENILLLGPPGTAKSLLARRVAQAFGGETFFQYLLTRFTTPDELFGPISLQALREADTFRRQSAGYLPTAEVVFLDEIFKASSAILNSLLTLINEKIFFNGAVAEPVPLMALLAASNEIPQEESLQALYDRFGVRLLIHPIEQDEAFLTMLSSPVSQADHTVPAELCLRIEAVEQVRRAARQVQLSARVEDILLQLRLRLHEKAMAQLAESADPAQVDHARFYVSDRRWRQAIRLLRTSAFVHDRKHINEIDCALLTHCLWNHPDDAEDIAELVSEVLEGSATGYDLDLQPVTARWRDLIADMVRTDGVAQRIDSHFRIHLVEALQTEQGPVSWIALTPAELERARKHDAALLLHTHLWWDSERSAFVQLVQSGPCRGQLRSRHFGMLDSVDALYNIMAAPFRSLVGEVFDTHPTLLQPSEAMVTGVLMGFGGVHTVRSQHWLSELDSIHAALGNQEARLEHALARFDRVAAEHIFVDPLEVRCLRKGLVRATLALDEWRQRTTDLRVAIENGGRYLVEDPERVPGFPA